MRHERALLRVARASSLCHDDALDAYQRALEIFVRRVETVDPATEVAWLKVVKQRQADEMPGRRVSADLDSRSSAAGAVAGLGADGRPRPKAAVNLGPPRHGGRVSRCMGSLPGGGSSSPSGRVRRSPRVSYPASSRGPPVDGRWEFVPTPSGGTRLTLTSGAYLSDRARANRAMEQITAP
jgi:hypothetical protein